MRSQLLKGILEGCILAIIEREAVYGYTLSKRLHEHGLTEISEGTIYPVLLRLQKTVILLAKCVLQMQGQTENIIRLLWKEKNHSKQFDSNGKALYLL